MRSPKPLAIAGLVFASLAGSAGLQAQNSSETTAREVVQPLPTEQVQRLNRALMQLARRPRDVGVLVEAGNSALQLNDLDAAMGFFGRAQDLSPENPQVKMGMAAVYLRSDRAIDALRLFGEAEAAGASAREVLMDRGLAYDLIGNNQMAQTTYETALGLKESDETRRRLALSHAIAGDESAFERVLRPLLAKRDFGSYRTRAFGLAILGKVEEASAIADAVMPRDLAARMIPFLQFMPRLTRSQQAAAANLGIFPRAAEIGREDPRIAQFANEGAAIVAAADDRLVPAGAPLGSAPGSAESAADTREADVQGERATVPVPGFDLARFGTGDSTSSGGSNPATSVDQAFADLGGETEAKDEVAAGAVDLDAIDIPREVERDEEPPEPVHPSRYWVQVATGRNRNALKFDWRRFARRAPDLLGDFDPHVVRWGRTNRLLAGPVSDRSAARTLVNALRAKGIDTFSFRSAEGQEIQSLD